MSKSLYNLIIQDHTDIKKLKFQICCVNTQLTGINESLEEIQEEIDNLPDFSNVAFTNVTNEFTASQLIHSNAATLTLRGTGSETVALRFRDSSDGSLGGLSQGLGSGNVILETHYGTGSPEIELDYNTHQVIMANGTLRVQSALIGAWATDANYAIFKQQAQATNDYAFMQGPTGDSNFNAKSGLPISFRFSNAEWARLTETGLYIGGAANPATMIHLNSAAGQGQLRFSNGANYWQIGRDQDVNGDFIITANGTNKFLISPTAEATFLTDVTINTVTPIVKLQGQTNGEDMTFGFYAPVGSGGSFLGGMIGQTNSGEIKIGGFSAGGYFPIFYSNNNEIMRITTGGLVGIGITTGLLGKLHVQTDGSLVNFSMTQTGGDNILQFFPSADGMNYIGSLGAGSQLRFLNTTGEYRWYNSSTTESMSLNDAGNLELLGTISTGGGVAEWALGNTVTAPVALDTTQYLQVYVGGVERKLLLAS